MLGGIAVGLLVASSAPSSAGAARRTDPCARQPATVATVAAGFASLAHQGTGWVTADGYVPVPLPAGRTAWLMSDTLLGPPAVDATRGPTFVHNSIVVQRGRCFTPVMGGTLAAPVDLVPTVDRRACWPSAGVAHARLLVVFCTDVEDAAGPPGFQFRVTGTSLALFVAPSLVFAGRFELPFPEPAGIRWRTAVVRRGPWLYVYGAADGAQYVARVRPDGVLTGRWRFWTGRRWGSRGALRPMAFAGRAPATPLSVTARGRGYLGVAFAAPLPDPTIRAWTARVPQGPWRRSGTVATASTAGPGQYAYDARAVDLGRAGWAIVYNVNDPVAVGRDPSAYGGRFVRAPKRLQGAAKR